MLTGDTLSQWLQRRVGTVVYGPLVQLSPSGLVRVSDRPDSHQVRIALPVVYGGQAAVARAAVDGVDQALALRVQAVSAQAERARQMERLVSMLTVAQAARANPVAYPAVLPVLESFVVTAPGDEMAVTSPDVQYELWCDLMPWCPSNLVDYQKQTGPAGPVPNLVLAQMVPVISTVHTVHRNLGIIHRDITPDNVLVDTAGRLLLADWGVAHTIAPDQTSTYTQLVGNRGFCLPPETLAGDTAVGRYTDAWYLGCLLVWMLTGQSPGPQHGPTWLPEGLPGGRAGAHLVEVVQGLCWPDPRQRMDLADAATRLHRLTSAGPAEWTGPAPARPVFVPPAGPAQAQQSTTLPSSPGAPVSVALPPGVPLQAVVLDPVARRPGARIATLVSVLVVVVLALAGVVAWLVTRSDSTAAPMASPSTTAVDPNCWTATVYGECPAFDVSAMSYAVFRGHKDDGVEVICYPVPRETDSGLRAAPETMAQCGWTDANIWVYITKFVDIDTMMDYYGMSYEDQEDPSSDVPPFASGPDGPSFYHVHDDGVHHAVYCFAELPMCLEAFGSDDTPIPLSTRYFYAIPSSEADRIVEYLAAQP
ncbi:MAG: protein kinase [Micrococcales bacterium]|nr:protein kinase [Micrococcales bacterium]